VLSLPRFLNVAAGLHDEAVGHGKGEEKHGVLSFSGTNIVAGLHDEAISSGGEKRSTVCCPFRGINVVAGLHGEVLERERKSTVGCLS
jgi:hypothetical protein